MLETLVAMTSKMPRLKEEDRRRLHHPAPTVELGLQVTHRKEQGNRNHPDVSMFVSVSVQ